MTTTLNYIAAALFVAGIRFDLPICLNLCLGTMLGHALGAFIQYKIEKNINEN